MIDYHVHSSISGDCDIPMADMAAAALKAGVCELCFTEHIDIDLPTDIDFSLDLARYRAEFAEVKARFTGINIRMGVEAGLDMRHLDEISQMLFNLDYVVGSQHIVNGTDPYNRQVWEEYTQHELYDTYIAEVLQCMSACDFYDVLGHLGYIAKFCPYEDRLFRYSDYTDAVDEVLKRLVQRGKGLEINTNGLYMTPDTMPERPIAARFFELGGEIVTVGSDAHYERVVGHAVSETLEMLKSIGFRYVCAFDARKPRFITII
jgi:histidinol-phosphatase (PHP family)